MIYDRREIPERLRKYFIRAECGLESTPQEYVAKLVEVFREVRRVLRDDGTLWLNLGDTYCNYRVGDGGGTPGQTVHNGETRGKPGLVNKNNIGSEDRSNGCPRRANRQGGLKEKDLVGIPWRVAFALQADGWYLRQDIIWHKPNPMPESVRDRCTKAHEYIFLLSKSQRYYYDADAIAEPVVCESGGACFGKVGRDGPGSRRISDADNDRIRSGTRNKRSVWTVTTKPYKGAHFATFPPKLIEPCVLAGCPEGGVVLDPFNGSGTTGDVSLRFGRRYIGIELNDEYVKMSCNRLKQSTLF